KRGEFHRKVTAMTVLDSSRNLGALLSSTPTEQAVIDDLVAANRILAGQLDSFDAFRHISLRDRPNAQRFLITRHVAPPVVTANDIVEYDFDGNAFGAKPGFAHALERPLHAEIYRMRPDVNSVVHSLSPAIIPFANMKAPLKPMCYLAAFLAPNVPV